MVGPDLTHLASRQLLLTGLLSTNESNIYSWINHPQKIKPGANMPDFLLEKDSIKAIAHYLSQLK
jgi:cytochrome c oxidase subunit 2